MKKNFLLLIVLMFGAFTTAFCQIRKVQYDYFSKFYPKDHKKFATILNLEGYNKFIARNTDFDSVTCIELRSWYIDSLVISKLKNFKNLQILEIKDERLIEYLHDSIKNKLKQIRRELPFESFPNLRCLV